MAIPLPPPPKPGGLGEKIERLLQRPFILVYESIIAPLGERVRAGVDNFLEQTEQAMLGYIRPAIGRILEMPDLPSEFRQTLERVNDPQAQVETITVASVAVAIVMGLIMGAVQPVARLVSYFVERIVQTGRPDPASLWRMFQRGALDDKFRDSYLDDLGVSDRLKQGFGAIAEIRPGIRELMTLWLHKHISDADFQTRLQQEGVPQEYIPDIVNLGKSIPGPGDLVTFALREVWREELRGELLSPDAPGRYYELMARQGYAREFAEDYWASHWQIPPINQGFEMFWRLKDFTESDLRALLTRLDVLPAYHDELIAIAYQTYTRVDVRRMYQLGILDEDDVKQSYLDLGYDETKAVNMTRFAIADAVDAERDLTKADILNGYRDGLLTKAETIDMLVSIHFPESSASFLVARVDAQREQKLVDAEIASIKDLFLYNDIGLTDAQQQLTVLGVQARKIELLLQEWNIDKRAKIKRPTRATLERLYTSGAISQNEFTSTLSDIGYQDKYIDWYMLNISLEAQAEAEKEEERARKERERVEKDKRKTDYQRNKSEIDVEIAEVQAAIAASDVALVETQNERNEALRTALPLEERAAIERDYMVIIHDADAAIGEAKIVVADLRAEETELRTRLAEITQSLAANVDVAAQVEIKAAIATMRTIQAQARDASAAMATEIARIKEQAGTESDPDVLESLAQQVLALQTQQAEQQEIVTGTAVDIKEAEEQLKAGLEEARRQELVVEQADTKVEIADISERIARTQAEIAETATVKSDAQNAMQEQLSALPGDAQALEIHQHYDTLIERIKAQAKELRARLAQLRVQKALLTFEYRGPSG